MRFTTLRIGVAFAACLLVCSAIGAFEPDSPESKALQEKSLGPSAVNADASTFKIWFHEAPSIFHDGKMPLKGLPLWHTNGELSDEIINEIFEVGQRNGFGGITFLPLTKTTPKYLSDEYLTQYGKALDLADKLGMRVIFYLACAYVTISNMDEKARYAVGIDLGSSKIRVVIGSRSGESVSVVGYGEVNSEGIRRGAISDLRTPIDPLIEAMHAAENMSGFDISGATLGVNSSSIVSTYVEGMVLTEEARQGRGLSGCEINPLGIVRLR